MSATPLTIVNFMENINSTQKCMKFLRDLGLLLSTVVCVKCNGIMDPTDKPARVTRDEQQWTCKNCKTSLSIRHKSIFKVIFLLLLMKHTLRRQLFCKNFWTKT